MPMPRLRNARVRILCLGAIGLSALAWTVGQSVSVQVQTAPLRSQPHYFMGKATAELAHGDRLSVIEAKKGWVKVRTNAGQAGWVNESALTHKKIVMQAVDGPVEVKAADEELTLAGRGFNKEIENSHRRGKQQLDYTAVDRMEKDPIYQVTMDQVGRFLQTGGVRPAKGGGK